MVTAEIAVALPALVLVTLAALTALLACMAQVRAVDAAAVAARLTARGQSADQVLAATRVVAPGAVLAVDRPAGGLVVAHVTVHVPMLGLGRLLPALLVRERAAAPSEPDS